MVTKGGGETDEQDELEAQFQTATEELQRTVMRLFQDRDIHPQLVVLALARVTGEVGAGRRWRASRTRGNSWGSWPRSCVRPGGSSGRCWRPGPCRPRGAPEPGSVAATGLDRRELVREQELPAPMQQGQAALFASQPVPRLGLAGLDWLPRPAPLGLCDQCFDLGQGALAIGPR